MNFASFDGGYLLVAAGMVLLLATQSWLISRRRAWLAFIVPVVYLLITVSLGVMGRLSSLSDFVVAALGLVGLVAWWTNSRGSKRKSFQEGQRLDITPLTAVDSRVSFPPPGTGVHRHYQPRVG